MTSTEPAPPCYEALDGYSAERLKEAFRLLRDRTAEAQARQVRIEAKASRYFTSGVALAGVMLAGLSIFLRTPADQLANLSVLCLLLLVLGALITTVHALNVFRVRTHMIGPLANIVPTSSAIFDSDVAYWGFQVYGVWAEAASLESGNNKRAAALAATERAALISTVLLAISLAPLLITVFTRLLGGSNG